MCYVDNMTVFGGMVVKTTKHIAQPVQRVLKHLKNEETFNM